MDKLRFADCFFDAMIMRESLALCGENKVVPRFGQIPFCLLMKKINEHETTSINDHCHVLLREKP